MRTRVVTSLACLAGLLCGCGGAETPAPHAPAGAASDSIRPDGPDDLFADVTAQAGIDFVHHVTDGTMDDIIESVGAGATWFDADGDGRLDLYLVDGAGRGDDRPRPEPTNRLLRNLGGGRFEDVTAAAGVGDRGFGFMALAGDLDGDGHTDLYVLNLGANRLYRNRGDGTFEDATERAGVGCGLASVAGALLDANRDGWIDIYVGNYLEHDPSYRTHYAPDVFAGPLAFTAQGDVLYLNRGDGTFRDASAEWGLSALPAGRAMGVSPLDFDEDGDLDLFVANDASANYLLRNEGDRFAEVALQSGVAYGVHGEATAAMAGAAADVDGDGRVDLHVTDARYGSLYVNQGRGTFVDRVFPSGIAGPSGQWASWGGGFLDVDGDGDLDLFVVNGDLHRATGRPDLILANDGKGVFTDVSRDSGAWFRAELPGRGAAFADFDDDGALDVVVTQVGDRAVLLRHRGPRGGHFVTLDLRDTPGRATACGARVTVKAGDRTLTRTAGCGYGYLAQHDPRLSFALGDATTVESVEVVWNDGTRDRFEGLAVDRTHVLRLGEAVR